VIQSGVPSLLVPNTQVADDQARRATIVASHAGAIVSGCETPEQRAEAVTRLLGTRGEAKRGTFDLDGAEHAADEILSLIDRRWRS
jgi:predicted glycosyltransferase